MKYMPPGTHFKGIHTKYVEYSGDITNVQLALWSSFLHHYSACEVCMDEVPHALQ